MQIKYSLCSLLATLKICGLHNHKSSISNIIIIIYFY